MAQVNYSLKYFRIQPDDIAFGERKIYQIAVDFGGVWYRTEDEIDKVNNLEIEMKRWCTENYGIISGRWSCFATAYFQSIVFRFEEESAALMFKLRFG